MVDIPTRNKSGNYYKNKSNPMKTYLKNLTRGGALILLLSCLSGCGLWEKMTVRSQSPEEKNVGSQEKPRLIGDIARPFGLHSLAVELSFYLQDA